MKNIKTKLYNGIQAIRPFLNKTRKPLYRTAMIAMIGFMALSNVTIPAHAAMVTISEENDPSDTQHAFTVEGDSHWNEGGTHISFYAEGWNALKADDEYVFCIEPWKTVTNGTVVNESDLESMLSDNSLKKTLSQIGYFGYWSTSQTRADYVTTRLMVWEARGWTVTQKPWYYDEKKAEVEEKIARSARTLSFSGTTQTVNVNQTVSFTDTNGVLSDYMKAAGYPNQNTAYTKDGVILEWNGNTLYLTPTINANDTFKFTSYAIDKTYVGTPIVYYNGNVQLTSPLDHVHDPAISWLDLNIQKYGKVRIVKHDELTGKVVKKAGIAYDIYKKSDDSYVSTITSDTTGIAESGLLEINDYYYIEKIAPTDYLINAEKHYFTVTADNVDSHPLELIANDTPVKGASTIRKEDPVSGTRPQGDAKLDGAIYGFYADENVMDPSNDGTIIYKKDQEVARRTIQNNTASVEGVPLGSYYWKEIEPPKDPEGYNIDPDKHPVNLRYKDQLTAIVQADTVSKDTVKEQAFQIIKLETPGHGEAPTLGGAGFTYILKRYVDEYGLEEAIEVAKLNDGRILSSEWGYMETDDDGYAMSKLLPYGTFVVHESVVPKDHYPVDDFEVTISEHNPDKPQKYRYFIDETYESDLLLIKEDAETGEVIPLSGMKFKIKALTKTADFNAGEYVKFKVKSPLPHYVDEWETTDQGKVILEQPLKAGTYQIEETQAQYGYLLNEEPLIFTITEGWSQVQYDEETIVTAVHFQNSSAKGQAMIDKQAELFKGYQSTMTEYGELFTPIYETGRLADVKFALKAETDIIGADGTVWYKAGETVETLITDGENVTKSSLLPIGTEDHNIYSLREVETQEGYVLDDTVYYFRFDYVDQNTPVVSPTWLDENGEPTAFIGTIENEKQTGLAIATKELEEAETNDTSEAYKNVTFALFSDEVEGLEADSLVGIGTLDEEKNLGISISREGSYYLQELQTDPLYQIDPDKYPFTYAYNGDQIQTITVNEGKPIINRLKRATIEVIKYTSDDLYYSKAEQVKLDEMGDMSEYMRNDRLKDEDRNYIAFTEFELATDKYFTNVIRTGMTDIDGRLVFDNLELGTFYIREKGSSDFYEINDEAFKVTLSKHGQFETVEVKNDLITSYVDVKKVDYYDHDRVLPFAGFTMYADPKCTQEISTIKTGIDGIAHFEIKFGMTVYIKETSAPVGYKLSDEVVEVTIDEDWINGDKETRVIVYPDRPLPSETVNTGDGTTPWIYMGMFTMSAAALLVLYRRRKEADQ